MTARRKPKSRSGPSLSDERRKALGYGRITLRLPHETLRRLLLLAKDAGCSRAEFVESAVDVAWDETPRLHGAD